MMPQQNKAKIIIPAIVGPHDPLREILRDYATAEGYVLSFYDHLFDALSRMPIMDNSHTAVITGRPALLAADTPAVFENLVNTDTTHYVLWIDGSPADLRDWQLNGANLYITDTIHRYDAILQRLAAPCVKSMTPSSYAPSTIRRPTPLKTVPPSEEELNALLGAGL